MCVLALGALPLASPCAASAAARCQPVPPPLLPPARPHPRWTLQAPLARVAAEVEANVLDRRQMPLSWHLLPEPAVLPLLQHACSAVRDRLAAAALALRRDAFAPAGSEPGSAGGSAGGVVPGPVFRLVLPALQPDAEALLAALDGLVAACTGACWQRVAAASLLACLGLPAGYHPVPAPRPLPPQPQPRSCTPSQPCPPCSQHDCGGSGKRPGRPARRGGRGSGGGGGGARAPAPALPPGAAERAGGRQRPQRRRLCVPGVAARGAALGG